MRFGPKCQIRSPWTFVLGVALDMECHRTGRLEFLATHGDDGIHGRKSKHYWGCAIDGLAVDESGIPAPTSVQQDVASRAQAKLKGFSQDFDVFLEDPGTANEHIHAELDLKGPVRV